MRFYRENPDLRNFKAIVAVLSAQLVMSLGIIFVMNWISGDDCICNCDYGYAVPGNCNFSFNKTYLRIHCD